MTQKATLSFTISEPSYYHREIKNDIPQNRAAGSWSDELLHVGTVALPFFSLYKPMSLPISLGFGALRAYSCASQLISSLKEGKLEEVPYLMLQTAIAVTALAGTLFAHPLGMLITTFHDLVLELSKGFQNLATGEHQQLFQNCLNIVNNTLYLALFLGGGLEAAVASLAMQVLIGLYHSYNEFKKGNSLEAVAHLLMATIRCNQLMGQIQTLLAKYGTEANRAKFAYNISNKKPVDKELNKIINKYAKDGNPYNAIYHAAVANDQYAVDKLIMAGADLNGGGGALYGAMNAKHIDLVKYLVERWGAHSSDALSFTSATRFWEGFDYFLSRGEKMGDLLDTTFVNTVEGAAVYARDVEVLREIVARGAIFENFESERCRQAYQQMMGSGYDAARREEILKALLSRAR